MLLVRSCFGFLFSFLVVANFTFLCSPQRCFDMFLPSVAWSLFIFMWYISVLIVAFAFLFVSCLKQKLLVLNTTRLGVVDVLCLNTVTCTFLLGFLPFHYTTPTLHTDTNYSFNILCKILCVIFIFFVHYFFFRASSFFAISLWKLWSERPQGIFSLLRLIANWG